MATGRGITRRAFLQAAAAAAGAVALPMASGVTGSLRSAVLSSLSGPTGAPVNTLGGPFFFTGTLSGAYATAAALCRHIIPTGLSASASPGAQEANAVQFIDMFLAAFELPSSLATNPAVYIQGRFSGRNPELPADPDEPWTPVYPPDEMEHSGGQRQFLGLTNQQAIAWYLRLYGSLAGIPAGYLTSAPSPSWLGQATGSAPLIPGVPVGGVRGLYDRGLAAWDAWSNENFLTPFASANPLEQEALVLIAGNILVQQLSGAGVPTTSSLPSLPVPVPNPLPPADASALFPVITLHTIQGCYCLPEYGGNGGTLNNGAAPVTWKPIGWDGDTMPLGNSLYDPDLYGVGQGPNAGFGDPAVFQPQGGYVEYRPVSTLDGSDTSLCTVDELGELIAELATIAVVKVLG